MFCFSLSFLNEIFLHNKLETDGFKLYANFQIYGVCCSAVHVASGSTLLYYYYYISIVSEVGTH